MSCLDVVSSLLFMDRAARRVSIPLCDKDWAPPGGKDRDGEILSGDFACFVTEEPLPITVVTVDVAFFPSLSPLFSPSPCRRIFPLGLTGRGSLSGARESARWGHALQRLRIYL